MRRDPCIAAMIHAFSLLLAASLVPEHSCMKLRVAGRDLGSVSVGSVRGALTTRMLDASLGRAEPQSCEAIREMGVYRKHPKLLRARAGLSRWNIIVTAGEQFSSLCDVQQLVQRGANEIARRYVHIPQMARLGYTIRTVILDNDVSETAAGTA